jgi:glycosyltransferase involved in cell wall biosynthesis
MTETERTDTLDPEGRDAATPLVSCIMPTCDRRAFVPLAVRHFHRQDYPRLELVVVDDGADPIADCLPPDPRIRYLRLDRRLTTGAKRNLACAEARGEIIAHWDDDDWYPPWRLGLQVRALLDGALDVSGASRLLFYDPLADRAFRYSYAGQRPWVAGSTQVYRKALWARNPFPDVSIGEDALFVWSSAVRVVRGVTAAELCVAMIHAGNTSRKMTSRSTWRPQPSGVVSALLGLDTQAYREAVIAHEARRAHLPPGATAKKEEA